MQRQIPSPSADSALFTSTAHLILFALVYGIFSPSCSSSKQKSYLLSTVSSGVMTALSVVALKEWLQGMGWLVACGMEPLEGMAFGGSKEEVLGGSLMAMRRVMELQELGVGATIFFRSYLIADLLVGSAFYRSNIGLLTGWVHHIVYILLTTYVLHISLAPVFLLTCIMELPTWHLGLSSLRPKIFRHDLTFLILFGLTRISFHAYVIWTFTVPTHTPVWMRIVGLGSVSLGGIREGLREVDGSFIPAILMAAAMPLHVMWFKAGVEGYARRWRAGSLGPRSMPADSDRPEMDVGTAAEIALPEVTAAHILAGRSPQGERGSQIFSPKSTISETPELQADGSGPATPEENVLTPYTPYGIPGNNAITSYFLPRTKPSATTTAAGSEIPSFRELLNVLPNFAVPDGLHFDFELPERLRGMHVPTRARLEEKREELKVQMAGALHAWRGQSDKVTRI